MNTCQQFILAAPHGKVNLLNHQVFELVLFRPVMEKDEVEKLVTEKVTFVIQSQLLKREKPIRDILLYETVFLRISLNVETHGKNLNVENSTIKVHVV